MSLYDVIDEIGKRQLTKTEMGDNHIWGVMVGIVAKNYDPDNSGGDNSMNGRVCVTIPTRNQSSSEGEASELRWARVAMPSGGARWGHYFLPEVGDQVLLAFEDGNIEKPYVIGCIPKAKDEFLKSAFDENNQIKCIGTKHGSSINFFDSADEAGENGEKDWIQIVTAQNSWWLRLDNDSKAAVLSDNESKNYIGISAKEDKGEIKIGAQTKVTIKVGDNIAITLNGNTGTVTIKADTIRLNAENVIEGKGKTVNLNGSEKVSAEGGNVTLEASSNLKLKSQNVGIGGT